MGAAAKQNSLWYPCSCRRPDRIRMASGCCCRLRQPGGRGRTLLVGGLWLLQALNLILPVQPAFLVPPAPASPHLGTSVTFPKGHRPMAAFIPGSRGRPLSAADPLLKPASSPSPSPPPSPRSQQQDNLVLQDMGPTSSSSSSSEPPVQRVGPRQVSRREAVTGLVGGSLGIAAIVKSAQDMARRAAQDPAASTFVWKDNVGAMIKEGGELFREVEEVYPLPFITYLARFLINFDPRCKAWWANDVEAAIPQTFPKEQRRALLFRRLAEFATSVEYGLHAYMEDTGEDEFCRLIKAKYEGKDGLEGRRAREQLAVLFSLLDPASQPTALIDDLLSSLPPSSGTARIFQIQQLDGNATRVVMEQTLRGMAQNPLMLLPARSMLPARVPLPGGASSSANSVVWNGGLLSGDGRQEGEGVMGDEQRNGMSYYYRVPGLESLGQRKRLVVDVEVDPTSLFGSRADVPVMKERSLGPATYALFALSGAVGCSLTHSVVIPLDVVKTRAQVRKSSSSSPAAAAAVTAGGGGLLADAKAIWGEEGLAGLVRGWEPTLLGYLYYGVTVYPGYEFFKRALSSAVGPAGSLLYHAPLVILAGALATIIACLGVCPAEAVRIRMVARGEPFTRTLERLAEEDGLSSLYDGFPPLLVRQVLFGMAKFLVFDSFGAAVFAAFPTLNDQVATQLGVSLVSGAVAGVVSAMVSQPADTVLSRMNAERDSSLPNAVMKIWRERGPGGFYLGIGSRCLWSGSIISGQFLLYDVFKNLLHVTPSDLGTFMDVIPSIQ